MKEKKKSTGIYFEVSEKEKQKIKRNAEICGLKQGEYIRQRALGYSPKAVLPSVFFIFCEKIDKLTAQPFSNEVNDQALRLLTEIENELLITEKEELQVWQQQVSGQSKDG